MNKLRYRVIFNRVRGLCVVVQETARSNGKGISACGAPQAGEPARIRCAGRLRSLPLALFGAVGAFSIWSNEAMAQVIADPNAPGRQRPTVLTAANGVLQINVQTPSATGVSRNTYSQFDVPKSGVILNNSNVAVQSQLGGWIAANPWISNAGARVILNEVNSNNPSQLRGYLEVAGPRAEIVIANGAGIVVDGGGFINVSRATLTTGTPRLDNGSLDGYTVQRGEISIEGAGLDARLTDYTSLISRSVRLNAGLWAQQLNVLSGANQVSVLDGSVTAVAGSGPAPNFGIDSASLGGMYANKIILVGTEAGVGVRNAGNIGASAGEVIVTSAGRLENSGNIGATQQLLLQAQGDIANSGTVYGKASVTAESNAAIVNTGAMFADAGLALSALGAIGNTGSISGQTGLQLQADALANSGTISSADRTVLTLQHDLDNSHGTVQGLGIELASIAGGINNQDGKIMQGADAGLDITAGELSNTNGGTVGAQPAAPGAGGVTLPGSDSSVPADPGGAPQPGGTTSGGSTTPPQPQAKGLVHAAGALNNDGGLISTGGPVTVTAASVDNNGGQMNLEQLVVQGSSFSNRAGSVNVLRDLTARTDIFDNAGGKLLVGGHLDGEVGTFNNTDGLLQADRVRITSIGTADNSRGMLRATGATVMQFAAGEAFNNEHGAVEAAAGLSLSAGAITGSGSKLTVSGDLRLDSGQTSARDATWLVGGGASLNTAAFDTTSGLLAVSRDLLLNSSAVTNQNGKIFSAGNSTIAAGAINNAGGYIQSAQNVNLRSDGSLGNQGGTIEAIGATSSVHIQAGSLDNTAGRIANAGVQQTRVIAQGDLSNGGLIGANGDLFLGALTAHNAAGSRVTAAGALDLGISQQFDNLGDVSSAGTLSFRQAGATFNNGGTLSAGGTITMDLLRIANNGGQIATALESGADISLHAMEISNRGGMIQSDRDSSLSVSGGGLDNTNGLIHATRNVGVGVGQTLVNQGGIIESTSSGSLLNVRAGAIDNGSGRIANTGLGPTSVTAAGNLSNAGLIAANGRLELGASTISNNGTVSGAGPLALIAEQQIDNTGLISGTGPMNIGQTTADLYNQGQIIAGDSLSISAHGLVNDGGQIATTTASGADIAIESGTLSNQGGSIQASGGAAVSVSGAALNNAHGLLQAGRDMWLGAAGSISNDAGVIETTGAAASLQVTAGSLDNGSGRVVNVGSGDATITVGGNIVSSGLIAGNGNLLLAAQSARNQTGGTIASGAGMNLVVTQQLDNGGTISSGGTLDFLRPTEFVSNRGEITAAGQANITVGNFNNDGGHIATSKESGADIALTTESLSNREGSILADRSALISVGGAIDNVQGVLQAGKDVQLSASGALNNSGGVIEAIGVTSAFSVEAASIDNTSGHIVNVGAGATLIASQSSVLNTGRLEANGAFQLSAGSVDNRAGASIATAGNLAIDVGQKLDNYGVISSTNQINFIQATDTVNNGGQFLAGGQVNLAAGTFNNDGGQIASATGSGANVSLRSKSLSNQGGVIAADRDVTLSVDGGLNNAHGVIRAGGAVGISAVGALDNTSGEIEAAGASSALGIAAQAIDNSGGRIVNVGQGETSIDAHDLIRSSGTIAGNGNLSLRATSLQNESGATLAGGSHLELAITQLLNNAGAITSIAAFGFREPAAAFYNSGKIVSGGTANIEAGSFSNDGGVIATVKGGSADVAINAQTLSNRGGTILADGSAGLSTTAGLDNTGGTIQAQQDLRIATRDSLLNDNGVIEAAGAASSVDVRAGAIDNTVGRLVNVGSGDTSVSTSGSVVNSGIIAGNGKLNVAAEAWQNKAGATIVSGNDMDLAFALQMDNQGDIASGGKLDFSLPTAVVNNGGQITAAGNVNLTVGSFNNNGGQIATLKDSGASVSLASNSLSNVGGSVLASGNALLSVTGAVDNSAGLVQAGEKLQIAAGGALANRSGVIEAVGATSTLSTQALSIDNTAGRLVNAGSGATSVTSQTNVVSSGTIAGNGDLLLSAQTLQNATGGVLSSGGFLDLAVSQEVDNQGTVNSAGALDFNQSAASFNNTGQIVAGGAGRFIEANFSNAGLIATATNSGVSIVVDSLSFSNRNGSIVASGSGTFVSGGALDNSHGTLQVGADLQLNAAGALNNSAGAIEATGATSSLLIQAASVDSSAGRIVNAGTGSTGVRSEGDIVNSGKIAGNGALELDARTLQNNAGGSVAAARDLELSITQQLGNQGTISSGGTLNFSQPSAGLNNGGQIVANGNVIIAGGQINNDGGMIATAKGSGSALTLSGQQLSNQGGAIVADGAAVFTVLGPVNNAQGTLEGGTGLLLAEGGILNNTGGSIESLGGVLDVTAQSITNGSGRIINAGSGDTTLSSASDITSTGVIGGNGNLKLIALSAHNGTGGVIASGKDMGLLITQSLANDGAINSAGTLTFNQAAASLNNSGQIISGGDAIIIANHLTNDGGQIGTGIGSGADLVLTTQQMSNQGGHLSADRDLSVRTSDMGGMGELAAGRDLSLTMNGDYTQGDALTMRANRDLNLTISGNFTNTDKFDTVRNLSLSANQIVNQSGAEIGGQGVTLLAAGALTNAGAINGSASVDVTAASIDNSNSIIGGDLTLRAQSINNSDSMALLGSTGNMALLASNELNNTAGATIYSAANIAIAADASRTATGIVNNTDSTIEAAGDLDLAATTLNNVRSNVNIVQVTTVDETVHMTLPSWGIHGDNHNAYETTAANYAPHEVYFVNPNDILENATYVTPDGYTIGRAVIRTHANDSAFFSAISGLYSAYGDRERITMSDGTRVLYYTYRSDNVANPDQGGVASDAYQFVDTVSSWTNAGPTFSNQYGSCSSDCVRFVTQPDYNDPRTTIIRDNVRALAPQAGKLEASRDARHVATEDQVATGAGGPTQILAGGNMHLTVSQAFNNRYGNIVASGVQIIDGTAVAENQGATLHRTHSFFGTWRDDDGDVTAYTMPSLSEVIGSATGLISGGKGVDITGCSFTNIDVSAGTVGETRATVNVIGSSSNNASANVDASATSATNAVVGSRADTSGVINTVAGRTHVDAGLPLNTAVAGGYVEAGGQHNTSVDVDARSSATVNRAATGVSVQGSGQLSHAALAGQAHASGIFGALLENVRTARSSSIAQGADTVRPDVIAAQGAAQTVVPVAPNGLSIMNPDPNGSYLFETRREFANHGAWVSSDYLLKTLNLDPTTTQKRLGDGFYEQRLVREQLFQLTGGAPQDGLSDDSRYRELLTSGATFAKAFNLRPGIALSAEQVARLTSDIVWLESETVRLPDGSTQTVLVPKVYLAHAAADALKPRGALVTGDSVRITTTDGIVNRGGLIDGGSGRTLLVSGQDIVNAGGSIRGGAVTLAAANDVHNESLGIKQTYATAQTSGSYRLLSNQATITASGSLDITAGRDLSDVAGKINAASVTITAGRDASFSTLQTGTTYRSQVGEYSENDSTMTHQLSQITTVGGMRVSAGRDLRLTGTQASIGGAGVLIAGRDMSITSVMTEVNTDQHNNPNSKMYDKQVHQNQTVVGSAIAAGKSLDLLAGISELGTLKISGSGLEAGGAVTLGASGDIAISSVLEHHLSDTAIHRESSSFLKSSSTTATDFSEARKVVGSSVSGSAVTIASGKDIRITRSAVVGDNAVNLTAANGVTIEAATATSTESHHSVVKNSGFLSGDGFGFSIGTRTVTTDQQQDATTQSGQARSMVGSIDGNLTIHAGDAVKIAGSDLSAGHDIDLSGKSVTITPGQDDVTGKYSTKMTQTGFTLALGGSVVNAIQTADAMRSASRETTSGRVKAMAAATTGIAVANAARDIADNGPSVRVSLTFGHSESEQLQTTASTTHVGSVLTAGHDVTITATGAGADSVVNIVGSDVIAKNNVTLSADNQVNLLAAQDHDSQHSQSRSQSAAIGVAAVVGKNTAAGITAGIGASRGSADGNGTTQINSHVSAGETLSITSGGDTDIKGGVASGKQVKSDVSGNLNIESLQDTAKFDSKDQGVNVNVIAGVGTSVSGGINQARVHNDYASVQEQSGIRAGDGGFQIKVSGNTDLKGSVISNTTAGEATSSLTTATLTHSDIVNHATMHASSVGVSGGITVVGNGTGKGAGPGGIGLMNMGGSGAGFGLPGLAVTSNSNTSLTLSGVSSATLTITSDAAQRGATGAGAQESVARINRAVSTAANTSARLLNNFDPKSVQATLAVTAAFSASAATAVGDYAKTKLQEAVDLRTKANGETDPARQAELIQQASSLESNWKEDGAARVALHSLIGAFAGGAGGMLGAGTTALVTPAIAEKVAQLDVPDAVKHSLIKAASAVVGAAAGGEAGTTAAVNEVQNNYLKHVRTSFNKPSEQAQFDAAVAACNSGNANACNVRDQWIALSQSRDQVISDACSAGNSSGCHDAVALAQQAGNKVIFGSDGRAVVYPIGSPELSAEPGIGAGSFHEQVSRSTSEGLLYDFGGLAGGLIASGGMKALRWVGYGSTEVSTIVEGGLTGTRTAAETGSLAPGAISDIRAISAGEANAPFLVKGWSPPYDVASQVRTFMTNQEIIFVRVSTVENPQGAFLVRASEIEGMTPVEIQQHLALPNVPTQIAEVAVPAGTRMQVGRVAAQPLFGAPNKGGVQYQLLDQIPASKFGTPRPIIGGH